MKLFCANCGKPLQLTRKALPKLGTIVDLVNYHECSETPIPFDLNGVPDKPMSGYDKFIQTLNALEPSRPSDPLQTPKFNNSQEAKSGGQLRGFGGVGTDDLRDRRFDAEPAIKSTAPQSIADQIKAMSNSIPVHDLKGIEEGETTTDSEMGG